MMRYEIIEQFEEMVEKKDINECLAFIADATKHANYEDTEQMVIAVLRAENFTLEVHQEVLEAVLTAFFNSREENHPTRHGYWVHSLSHFVDKLWELGMMDWIKKFHEAAITGAKELNEPNCLDRLLESLSNQDPEKINQTDFYNLEDLEEILANCLDWQRKDLEKYIKLLRK
jgi:hypothetical protein